MDAIAVILDPRHKLDYYEATEWEPDHVAHARGTLLQAIAKYAATAPPQPDQAAMTVRSGPEGIFDRRRGVQAYKEAPHCEGERAGEVSGGTFG